jgi:hypothetical protein
MAHLSRARWCFERVAELAALLRFNADIVETLLATLERPTALAFAPNGTLYVSVMGPSAAEGKSTGQLLRFEGL